jgi:hypothetical protein
MAFIRVQGHFKDLVHLVSSQMVPIGTTSPVPGLYSGREAIVIVSCLLKGRYDLDQTGT